MRDDLTEIVVLLDRSGSMGPVVDATIEGFNGFLESQRAQSGEALFSLVQFSDAPEVVCWREPLRAVRLLSRESYIPDGSTALLDAWGTAMAKLEKERAATPEPARAAKVVFVVLTDGEENASRELSLEHVVTMVKRHQRDDGWVFLFLGANQDSIAVAEGYGVGRATAMGFDSDSKSIVHTFTAASNLVGRTRGGGRGRTESFSDVERRLAKSGKDDDDNGRGGGRLH